MLLTEPQLESLKTECERIIADPSYKSPEAYIVLEVMCNAIINVRRYRKLEDEIKEQLVLDAICKCYVKIPRFNLNKAEEARLARGREPDLARCFYRYVEIIIVTSMITSLSMIFKKRMNYISIESIGQDKFEMEDSIVGNKIELPYLETEDVDDKIDAEWAEQREIELMDRLDKLEKLEKNRKRRMR